MRADRVGRCAAAVAVLVSLGVATACGSSGSPGTGGPHSDPGGLLTAADLPTHPSSVTAADSLPDAAPSWACSGTEDALLHRSGWDFRARRLSSSTDGYAVYSALFDNPDGGADAALPRLVAKVRSCAKGGDKVPDYGLVKAAAAYKHQAEFIYVSRRPGGKIEARRGYTVVDDHHIVEVTVLGLDDQQAPAVIGDLLHAAVSRAESAVG